jgi:hypothetical protein
MHPREDVEVLEHPSCITGLSVDGAIDEMVGARLAEENEEEGSQC